ncbi:MAG: flagellar FliJ family protein [Geminicoccaceae bacterium]
MKALGVLQRLAGQAVDRERRALLAIGAEITEVEGRIENWMRTMENEASASPDFRTSGATLPAFIEASKARVRALEERLADLQQAHEAQLERVRRERVEEKRFERLAERRSKQAALEAAAREQKTIDDLVAMRRSEK